MTEKTISISVPYEANALNEASKMLYNLAARMGTTAERHPEAPGPVMTRTVVNETVPPLDDAPMSEEQVERLNRMVTPVSLMEERSTPPTPENLPENRVMGPAGHPIPTDEALRGIRAIGEGLHSENMKTYPRQIGDPTPEQVFAPPAPDAAPPAPPAPAAAEELDPSGMPWDGRIHGRKRARLAKDNCWKKIRGVSDALVAEVEAERRQTPPAADAPPAPPKPPTPAAVGAAPAHPPVTFPQLMQLVNSPSVGMAAANKIATEHGFSSIALAATQPDKIPALYQAIKEAF